MIIIKALNVFVAALGFIVNPNPYEVTSTSYNVNFANYEVANFDNYYEVFSEGVVGQYSYVYVDGGFQFSFNTCVGLTSFTGEVQLRYSLNGIGNSLLKAIPFTLLCGTSLNDHYFTSDFINLVDFDPLIVDYIYENETNNRVDFLTRIVINQSVGMNGKVLTIKDFTFDLTYAVAFNTNYLFNTFMSRTQYNGLSSTSGWSITTDDTKVNLNYLFSETIATETFYGVFNTNQNDIGTTEKLYAVQVDNVNFIGDRIGANLRNNHDLLMSRTMGSTGTSTITHTQRVYYLNAAAQQQDIVEVPEFLVSYQDCGDLFALNVPCYLNNALAWVVNDAPIISPAINFIYNGIDFMAQGLGIFSVFIDDGLNIFTWFIVGGFGIIVLKWIIKQDE
jgi:hypothetical protein